MALATAGLDFVCRDRRSSHTSIEDSGIEVGPVRPIDGAQVRMHAKFSEAIEVFERGKDALEPYDG